ncbi:MAG: hypothetical protein WB799_07525 [Candidatus Sulfotelmatobacter sp.]
MSPLGAASQSKEVLTLGELFPDGSAIDRLRQNLLVLWHKGNERIQATVECNGRIYTAATLDSKLEEVLRLPARTEDFGTTDSLTADVSQLIRRYAVLDDAAALLVTSFIVSTWVVDCLPSAPCLNVWGPAGTETILVDLLSCLCRHPLRVAEPSVRELLSLPPGLAPTLIIKQPSERTLTRLLAATTEPDVNLLRDGRCINVQCPTIVCTGEPVAVSALSFRLIPDKAEYRRIGKREAQELAEKFQPRLMRYRLSQHRLVADSHFDRPEFAPDTRLLARILGASVEGSPELQGRIVDALSQIDEQCKVEQSQGLGAVILEALLALCHEHKPRALVLEVTKLANGILLGRHENLELTPKAVGGIMRKKLGLWTERHGPGYELQLIGETPKLIHHLAAAYNVLSMQNPVGDCLRCDELNGSSRNASQQEA